MSAARARVWKRFLAGQNSDQSEKLGDFTTGWRVLWIALLAICIGILSSYIAFLLLRLIGLFTNLFFYQRLSTEFTSPAHHHLGALVILVPVLGAIIVGLLARYGSERIRGHGIPEAIESILLKGGTVEPKLAILKPLSAAISIGSGGPFGAEGPIIMTGGAFGSMVAQFFHLTSSERRTLMVAGAAAGMSATFATPVAAALLSVELLLFEWKPRSLIPVAMASAAAAAARRYVLGLGPLFPVLPHSLLVGPKGLLGCVVIGVLAGALSALLTLGVYRSEDAFQKLPIHWMWWPAIGAIVVGVGGFIFPPALGVGYDVIGKLLQSDTTRTFILSILIVKSVIWAVSLGSGTSGGVLAPLLMMGGALGGLASPFLPQEGVGFWPLISMAAVLGGTMRSPFTAVIFALELTHDIDALLPLMIAAMTADAFTVLALRRSILTEKISRRGYHLSREYSVDPLEILFVREVMRTSIVVLPTNVSVQELSTSLRSKNSRGQRLYPVLNGDGKLSGVLTRGDLYKIIEENANRDGSMRLTETLRTAPTCAYPDEPLRVVVYRMAETGFTRFPVVERDDHGKLLGIVSLDDLLKARVATLEAETRRERVLRIRYLFPFQPNRSG